MAAMFEAVQGMPAGNAQDVRLFDLEARRVKQAELLRLMYM